MNVKEKLLASSGKRRYECISVKLNGEELIVWFRSIFGNERDAFEESILVERKVLHNGKVRTKRQTDMKNIRAKLIALSACKDNQDPTPLFTADEVKQLGEVDAAVLDPLFDKASQMAGMSEDDVKELVGN